MYWFVISELIDLLEHQFLNKKLMIFFSFFLFFCNFLLHKYIKFYFKMQGCFIFFEQGSSSLILFERQIENSSYN